MYENNTSKKLTISTIILILIIVFSVVVGGLLGFYISNLNTSKNIDNLQDQVLVIQENVSDIIVELEENILYTQINEKIIKIEDQITTIEQNISNFESNQDFKDLEIVQDQLLILQEEIDNFQEFVPDSTKSFTNIQGNISSLENQIVNMNNKIISLQNSPRVINQSITYILYENISLSSLFENVRKSVVIVEGIIPQYDRFGRIYYSQVQGSGFVYNVDKKMVILTNYHVVNNAININVSFTTGNSYPASVLGSDQYSDLAVLTTEASLLEYFPLITVSSSSLSVGDPVIVVGTPYGLSGSMSEGIVSALNRTLIIEDFSVSNIIQTTAPINPGNSGGPLLNYQGQVVGIVTAIIQDSQGIGFAIPSDTIVEKIANMIL